MKVRRIRTWEDIEALPEGEWVEVEEGMDFKWVDYPAAGGTVQAIVPAKRRLAKSRAARKSTIPRAPAKRPRRMPEEGSAGRTPIRKRRK